MMQYYSDKNKYNTAGFSASADPYFQGTIPDISWEGDHTVRIVAQQGTTKKYRKIEGPSFVITYRNPCRTAIVSPKVINKMTFTVGDLQAVNQFYDDFMDDVSTLYGNGYDKCGERYHYITDKNGSYRSDPDKQLQTEFLRYQKFPLGDPSKTQPAFPPAYKIAVLTQEYSLIGRHDFIVNVGLKDYPTATLAKVPLEVMIAPCIVRSYTAPQDFLMEYAIGNRPSTYTFNYLQEPCKYTEKLSAVLENGKALPSFMTLSQIGGFLRIYPTNQTDAGDYNIIVTGTLSNFDVFTSPTTTIDPSLRVSAINPPSSFIYKQSFKLTLRVSAPLAPYVSVNNTAPFFVPKPMDVWFYATDKFVKGFGPAYDNEGNAVTVTPDFGNAARFVIWDRNSNTMTVPANATTPQDVGDYLVKINLSDNVVTQGQTLGSTVVGNVTYQFRLTIYNKPMTVAVTERPPDVRLEQIFTKYNTSVIDVRSFDRNSILNATDTTVIVVPKPQQADQSIKIVEIQKDQTKSGATNSTVPQLPRVVMTEQGTIKTNIVNITESLFVVKEDKQIVLTTPKPFVKSLDTNGILKIGFDQKMKVPKNLDALNQQKVALRWMQQSAYNETYLTPEGYRDFEIRPAVDLQLVMSPDNQYQNQNFTYEIIDFTEDDMTIKVTFGYPDFISIGGISSDALKVTFWSNELLQGENGLKIEEGQTVKKNIIQQVDAKFEDNLLRLGRSIGILVAIVISGGLILCWLFNFDQTPFWLFFNVWQLFLHVPLLNLKLPGFISISWRQQLGVWTLRSQKVNQLMNKISGIPDIERRSYTILLEAAGFDSTQIYVNLGLILWIPAFIIALMPFAWAIDTFCSIQDDSRERFGGRKPLTKKPLLQLLTNLLIRFALMSVLDIMMCVFISFKTSQSQEIDETINMAISFGLVGMLGVLVLLLVFYGAWRYWKAKNAKVWKDYEVSGYVTTLFEGANPHHPERTTFYLVVFMLRQTIYAATIVLLYEEPVFQIFILLSTSIAYNCLMAWCRPFYQTYNMTLHYINEMSFFFFLAMSMTFTDFVSDVMTRTRIGSMLTTFMFMVMSTNIIVSLLAIIGVKCKSKKKPQAIVPDDTEEKVKRFELAFRSKLAARQAVQSDRIGLRDSERNAEDQSDDFAIRRDRFAPEPTQNDKTIDHLMQSAQMTTVMRDVIPYRSDFDQYMDKAMVIVDDQAWPKQDTGVQDESKIDQDDQLDLFYRYLNNMDDENGAQVGHNQDFQRHIERDDEEMNLEYEISQFGIEESKFPNSIASQGTPHLGFAIDSPPQSSQSDQRSLAVVQTKYDRHERNRQKGRIRDESKSPSPEVDDRWVDDVIQQATKKQHIAKRYQRPQQLTPSDSPGRRWVPMSKEFEDPDLL